jgi:putative ABC transport system substrate-binding protein
MLAKELVGLQPEVLVASSGFVVSALLRETRTIPIVFVTATDPVGNRYVVSQTRPGGNVTGFANNIASMGGKWLELLKEIAPGVGRVAVMFNPVTAPASESFFMPPFEAAAASLGVVPSAMPVGSPAEIESALAAFGRQPGSGLIVMPDNFTSVHRRSIVAQAARYRMPAIYPIRYFATAGGLMSYGADLIDLYRRVPTYVDRILKGASPADLPVLAPAKVDLVINLKAARELGLTVPRIMLARAEEVIE